MRKAGRLKLPFASLGVVALSFVLSAPLLRAAPRHPDASAIVKRSVVVNDSDWKAFPNYAHHERDITAKLDSSGKRRTEEQKTYRVLMIDGSP